MTVQLVRGNKHLLSVILMLFLLGCGGGSTADTIPPIITLLGDNPLTLFLRETYTEPGATAIDETDGNVTVTITGVVDTTQEGNYTRTYSATDTAGNTASKKRTVVVAATEPASDTTPPVITLNGDKTMVITQGDVYTEPGATAIDDTDGNVSVTITGIVDTTSTGSYTRMYTSIDTSGNEANATREVFVLSHALAASTFPAAFYPSGAHPRLWLTTERLTALNTQKNTNTPRWQRFKQMCDSIIDADASNDPWNLSTRPENYTAPLALMYRLNGNAAYADKALELMDQVDDNLSYCGDPNHTQLCGDSDHESWYFLGLTYDWLYNYNEMNATRKAHYRTLMQSISDQFYAEDQTASGTDSDFNLLTALHHLVMGIALYDGVDANATEMLDRAWLGWQHGYCVDDDICTSNRGMVRAGLGGVYFTGMAYFPSTDIIGISGFEMSMKSACGYDVHVQEPDIKPFWGNIIRRIIDLTEPTRTAIFDYGSWQDPNTLSAQPWLQRALTIGEYFSAEANDTATANLGRGFVQQVNVGDYNDYFLELFYDTPGATATNPYTASLPRVTFAQSPDFLLFRSEWESNDSWGVFRGDGSHPLDQRAMDMGGFSLWRGGSYLTKGARNYEALSHGDFFNTLSLENSCTLNGTPCSGTAIFDSAEAATISRHRESENPLLAYGMLQADGQWDDNPSTIANPVDNIVTYRRHFVWLDNYVVLFDRVRASVPIDITYRLRALREPTISGTTVTQQSADGNATLMQRTLEPAGITLVKIDENATWAAAGIPDWIVNESERHWQSVINFAPTDTLNILNVLQTGNAALNAFDTLEHLNTDGNSGVRIGDRVVCFNSTEALRTSTTYTLHGATASMWHLVGDLEVGAYRLRINGTLIGTLTVTDTDHAAWFETTATGNITVSLERTP